MIKLNCKEKNKTPFCKSCVKKVGKEIGHLNRGLFKEEEYFYKDLGLYDSREEKLKAREEFKELEKKIELEKNEYLLLIKEDVERLENE